MTEGDDTISGNPWAETLSGLGGGDSIYGFGSNDLLLGGEGDDLLDGGDGADTLNGGGGRDTANYAASAVAVTIVLASGLALGGQAAGDVLLDIENVTGSAQADSLVGSAGDNRLAGGNGTDSVEGGQGGDTLLGGGGSDSVSGGDGDDLFLEDISQNDTLHGGAGRDTLSFATLVDVVGVGASLVEGGFAGAALGDVYLGMEDLVGSALADTLTGNGLANLLAGGAGNDVISGLNGADTILGEGGNDSLLGGGGDDLLIGGAGLDTLRGGPGNDTYEVEDAGDLPIEGPNQGFDTVRTALNWTLGINLEGLVLLPGALTGTGNNLDNLIEGNALSNTLTGNAGNDTLRGGAGDDTARGGNGNDRLEGGPGNDRLEGGLGWDTIVSPFLLEEVALRRLLSGALLMTDPAGADLLFSIEELQLGEVTWKIAPAVVPIGPSTPWNLRVTRLDGPAGSGFGSAVGSAGDADGDGRPDLLVGAPGFNGGDGASWLVWGRQGGFGTNFSLTDGSVRFISDALSGAQAGRWVGGFGDTDGDSYDDVGIGLPLLPFLEQGSLAPQPVDGVVSLLRGRTRSDFAVVGESAGFLTDGTSNTVAFGEAVTGQVGDVNVAAGDLNGDGLADIGIGGKAASGYVSILLGSQNRLKQIGLADGSVTRISTGLTGIDQGTSLGGGGDVNADGFDDLVIGSPGVNGGAGGAWVLLGKANGWGGTISLGAGAGFVTISPTVAGDQLGRAAAVIGDWNGDGIDDFAIGAPGNNGARGSVFIVPGGSLTSPLNLTTAPGVVRFNGVDALDGAGSRLSRAGDVNGDGYADLLVGGGNGDAWLVLGRPTATTVAVQSLATPGVIKFEGTDGFFGRSVAGAGDVDGDGLDDVIVGQSSFNAGAGAAWIIHGDHWLGV
ncbi:beta strand repeat-containing protein [Falsiroseomonas oryzae]|uniref:beta strand repeat-containing protein n=1 Tax=Falsiroseomonas oryzae TaxID=2766473 RepID=UPI0022EA5625|nr:FG-GAP-like repeat-containing protein [Roseomonas sp. MO-31]